MGLILFLSAQTSWRTDNLYTRRFKSVIVYASLVTSWFRICWTATLCGIDSAFGFLQITLDAAKEIEVMIDASWRNQLRLFHKLGWVALA